jgi:hypothetical protein
MPAGETRLAAAELVLHGLDECRDTQEVCNLYVTIVQ